MNLTVEQFNGAHPIGTRVRYVTCSCGEHDWKESVTRTPAWLIGEYPCVSVEGFSGGIALTHVEVLIDLSEAAP